MGVNSIQFTTANLATIHLCFHAQFPSQLQIVPHFNFHLIHTHLHHIHLNGANELYENNQKEQYGLDIQLSIWNELPIFLAILCCGQLINYWNDVVWKFNNAKTFRTEEVDLSPPFHRQYSKKKYFTRFIIILYTKTSRSILVS